MGAKTPSPNPHPNPPNNHTIPPLPTLHIHTNPLLPELGLPTSPLLQIPYPPLEIGHGRRHEKIKVLKWGKKCLYFEILFVISTRIFDLQTPKLIGNNIYLAQKRQLTLLLHN